MRPALIVSELELLELDSSSLDDDDDDDDELDGARALPANADSSDDVDKHALLLPNSPGLDNESESNEYGFVLVLKLLEHATQCVGTPPRHWLTRS